MTTAQVAISDLESTLGQSPPRIYSHVILPVTRQPAHVSKNLNLTTKTTNADESADEQQELASQRSDISDPKAIDILAKLVACEEDAVNMNVGNVAMDTGPIISEVLSISIDAKSVAKQFGDKQTSSMIAVDIKNVATSDDVKIATLNVAMETKSVARQRRKQMTPRSYDNIPSLIPIIPNIKKAPSNDINIIQSEIINNASNSNDDIMNDAINSCALNGNSDYGKPNARNSHFTDAANVVKGSGRSSYVGNIEEAIENMLKDENNSLETLKHESLKPQWLTNPLQLLTRMGLAAAQNSHGRGTTNVQLLVQNNKIIQPIIAGNTKIEEPEECMQCHKIFKRRIYLQRHMAREHWSRAKIFQCDKCNYETKHQSNLLVHKRTHTGERPYNCGACGQRYTQGHLLKAHIRSRHASDMVYYNMDKRLDLPGQMIKSRRSKSVIPSTSQFLSANRQQFLPLSTNFVSLATQNLQNLNNNQLISLTTGNNKLSYPLSQTTTNALKNIFGSFEVFKNQNNATQIGNTLNWSAVPPDEIGHAEEMEQDASVPLDLSSLPFAQTDSPQDLSQRFEAANNNIMESINTNDIYLPLDKSKDIIVDIKQIHYQINNRKKKKVPTATLR